MGHRIYSSRKGPRKVVLSPRAGLHMVLGSQSTSSRSTIKRMKILKLTKDGAPTRSCIASASEQITPFAHEMKENQFERPILKLISKPKTRREFYGSVLLPTKPANSGKERVSPNREISQQFRTSGHISPEQMPQKEKSSWIWRPKIRSS